MLKPKSLTCDPPLRDISKGRNTTQQSPVGGGNFSLYSVFRAGIEADGWACARHLRSGSVGNWDDVLGRFVAETHPLDHGEAVFLAQVAINLHRQRAAVFMTKPPADGGNVHARLDARCREEMAKVVVGEVRESKFPAG